jgi:hypothetical protein
MKDFLGQDINIGDSVIYVRTKYVRIWKGTVEGYTPQMVKIYTGGDPTYNSSHINVLPEHLIVVNELVK